MIEATKPILLSQILGTKELADLINDAVTSSDSSSPDALAAGIMGAIDTWVQGSVFNIAMTALIFITILFVFYGALLYFTAYGDENRATQAKKTLTYAFVGFAIAASAFGIANYVKRIIIRDSYEEDTFRGPVQIPGLDPSGEIPENEPMGGWSE